MTATTLAIVLLNSAGVIVCAVQLMLAARREHKLIGEVTELQAVVDSIMIGHGMPTIFAQRYDLEVAIDPTKMAPPGDE